MEIKWRKIGGFNWKSLAGPDIIPNMFTCRSAAHSKHCGVGGLRYFCSDAASTAQLCPRGYYCTDWNVRVACPAGRYGSVTGAATVEAACPGTCPPGRYGKLLQTGQTRTTEADACVQCPISTPHSVSPFASVDDCKNRPPMFSRASYATELPENSRPLTIFAAITGTDVDAAQALS